MGDRGVWSVALTPKREKTKITEGETATKLPKYKRRGDQGLGRHKTAKKRGGLFKGPT